MALQHLEKQQCTAVGDITFALFLEIQPQIGAVLGRKQGSLHLAEATSAFVLLTSNNYKRTQ